VTVRLRVEFDAVPENRIPDRIEGNECAPDELVVVEEGTHNKFSGNGRSQEGVVEARSHESSRRGKAHVWRG
jgi:hypothetical protein